MTNFNGFKTKEEWLQFIIEDYEKQISLNTDLVERFTCESLQLEQLIGTIKMFGELNQSIRDVIKDYKTQIEKKQNSIHELKNESVKIEILVKGLRMVLDRY